MSFLKEESAGLLMNCGTLVLVGASVGICALGRILAVMSPNAFLGAVM
jgi:hypothetical protein